MSQILLLSFASACACFVPPSAPPMRALLLSSVDNPLINPALPAPFSRQRPFSRRTTGGTTGLIGRMARFNFEFEEDFYFTLNVTRDADRSEIRRNYRLLAKEVHPDKFVEEMRFDPDALSTKDLRTFLESERVGVGIVLEKSELVKKAWDSHRRTGNVDAGLTDRRLEITDRFALLNTAYQTLYEEEERRNYDLSGDWGIPGLSGKTRKVDLGMGDKEEAARVRARGEAAQRTPLQRRVYEKYAKEKAERDAAEAEAAREREERRARELEERNESERLRQENEVEMTDAERREINQAKVKAKWGNAFGNIFGANAKD